MANYVIKNNSSLADIIKVLDGLEQNNDLNMSTGVLKLILKAIQKEIKLQQKPIDKI